MTYCFERVPAGCVRASFAPRGQRCSVSAPNAGNGSAPANYASTFLGVCSLPSSGMSLNPNRVVRKVTSVEEQEAENYRYWQSIPRRGQTRSRVRTYRSRIRDSGDRSEC